MSEGELLRRIAEALERLTPPDPVLSLDSAPAFVWRADDRSLRPVRDTRALPLDLLLGIDRAKGILLENTRHFAAGLPANNALLWGTRGMGKSAVVKAIHAAVHAEEPACKLVELPADSLTRLPWLLDRLSALPQRSLLFIDDLSFGGDDGGYRALKPVLEGGIAGRPGNVLLYATSNRRHLMPRMMIENEASTAINPAEAVDEHVALSDRFGIWLGFHPCDEATYQGIVSAYAARFGLDVSMDAAREWAMTRGARSGRVAWQFILDQAGRAGKSLGA